MCGFVIGELITFGFIQHRISVYKEAAAIYKEERQRYIELMSKHVPDTAILGTYPNEEYIMKAKDEEIMNGINEEIETKAKNRYTSDKQSERAAFAEGARWAFEICFDFLSKTKRP